MADKKDQSQQGKQDIPDQGEDQNRQGGFVHSSPEANVFPTGSRQGDNSDRSTGDHSAAGTPDEGRLGGSDGTSATGTTGNDPDR